MESSEEEINKNKSGLYLRANNTIVSLEISKLNQKSYINMHSYWGNCNAMNIKFYKS